MHHNHAKLRSRTLAFNKKKKKNDGQDRKDENTNRTCAAGNKIKLQNQKLRYTEKHRVGFDDIVETENRNWAGHVA